MTTLHGKSAIETDNPLCQGSLMPQSMQISYGKHSLSERMQWTLA
jgi:hypothetical protein